jgi:hypothetical protein
MFVVYAFDLIVKVWFVFIVLALFWWFSWTFLVAPLHLSFCIYHLPKRHMMSIHLWALSAFVFIIVLTWLLHPSAFAFLYSTGNKLIMFSLFISF